MKRLTRMWVRKAEADLRIARRESAAADRVNDGICFHCQQSAEKFLKALIQESDLAVPRTHSLIRLLDLLSPGDSSLSKLTRGFRMLSRYAVEARYPGFSATGRQAAAALRWAERIRAVVRKRLGMNE